MPFLAPTLDNADPFFTLVITPGYDQVKVAGQDQAISASRIGGGPRPSHCGIL